MMEMALAMMHQGSDRIKRAIEKLPEKVRLVDEARGTQGDAFDVLGRMSNEIGALDIPTGELPKRIARG
jgi:hypothetical protein